jgi:hypothetical protein
MRGLRGVTQPAQTFEVTVIIRATVSLRFDVVDTGSLFDDPLPEMVLTQDAITLQNTGSYHFPFRSITALVS